jgi:hypothetical protein
MTDTCVRSTFSAEFAANHFSFSADRMADMLRQHQLRDITPNKQSTGITVKRAFKLLHIYLSAQHSHVTSFRNNRTGVIGGIKSFQYKAKDARRVLQHVK